VETFSLTTPTIRMHRTAVVLFLTLMLGAFVDDLSAKANIAASSPNGLSASGPVGQYVLDAKKAIKNGDFRLAVILLKNAVTADPKNSAVRAQLGLVLLQSGDPVSAERELRQARLDGAQDQAVLPALFQAMLSRHEEQKLLSEFSDPGPNAKGSVAADTLKARAFALQQLGNPSDAAAAMDRSLALRRDAPNLLDRARLAQRQNNLTLAKSLTEEALKLEPSSLNAQIFKVGLLMVSNDQKAALALINQLAQQFPDDPRLRIPRIEIYLQLKQDSRARTDVDAILAKSPGAPIALYYKALIMARANDTKGAWHIAQSLPPEFIQSQASIAIMVSQMAIASGNVETGAAILNGLLAKSPDLVDVRLRLAEIRLRQSSPEAALSILQPIKDSNDPRALALLSQTYLNLHQYSNALDTLNKLSATGSASVGAKRELALVEMQSGQSDQAIRDLMELASKQPTDPTIVAPLIAALVHSKRFPEALVAADRLARDPKQRAQAYFYRSQILSLQNDQSGALAAVQQSLQLEPKNVSALYLRAGLLERSKKYAEADRDLQSILRIDPKNVVALIKQAEIAARQNQDNGVRTALTQATNLAPKNPAPRFALAKYQIARHDLKGALATATDLVRVLPTNADGLALLGAIQLSLGQKDQAIATVKRLTTLLPASASAQMLFANALLAKGDRSGASTALGVAAKADPNSIQVRSAQVNLMLANGDARGAIASAQDFRTSHPSIDADILVADTFIRAKEYSQASSVLSQSFAAAPNRKVLLLFANVAVYSGNQKRAETLLADWLATNQNDAEVRAQYASVLMRENVDTKARAQFELVLRQDPNNIVALNNLGWLLQKDDPKRALLLATQAVRLSPDSADVVDTLGWIKLQLNQPKDALNVLKRAHDLRPKDGEITYHLVLALDASGNRNSAKGLLKALLDSGVKFASIDDALKLANTWKLI